MPTAEIIAYFTAEKQGAILIASLGVVSAIFATHLWLTGSPFKAMFDLFADYRALVYTRWLSGLARGLNPASG